MNLDKLIGEERKIGRRPKTFPVSKTEVMDVLCELHRYGIGATVAADLMGYRDTRMRELTRDAGLTPLPHDNRSRRERLSDVPDGVLFRCETIREANEAYQRGEYATQAELRECA